MPAKNETLKKKVKKELDKPQVKANKFTNMHTPITRAQLGIK